MFQPFAVLVVFLSLLGTPAFVQAQAAVATETVRVTVSVNPDGSRTVYRFDLAHHQATATTTSRNGKPAGKIHYKLDDAGRFASGEIYGSDRKLRFKSRYQYDTAGRLIQETQLTATGAVDHKIVYQYDASGRQIGYAVYDAAGQLMGRTAPSKAESPTGTKGR